MNPNIPFPIIDVEMYTVYQNITNGKHVAVLKELADNKEYLERVWYSNNLFEPYEPPQVVGEYENNTFVISICISNICNMNCIYCFRNQLETSAISYDEIAKFITFSVESHFNAGKYIVDLSGSGEPLIHYDLLVSVGKLCMALSEEYRKEFIPTFATNGLLLSKEKVLELQKLGFIFGISLDGTKRTHDMNRKDLKGSPTFHRIMKNVKTIKNTQYIGVAMTLSPTTKQLLKSFKYLSKYFPTISIKPLRSNDIDFCITHQNVMNILEEYEQVIRYSVIEATHGNISYIFSLINGDDYWGKYFTRIVSNARVITRCDAGIGRWSIHANKSISVCPSSRKIEELCIGTMSDAPYVDGINRLVLYHNDKSKCQGCEALFVCGGECFVESYLSTGAVMGKNEVMCIFKKRLYRLAMWARYYIHINNSRVYSQISKLSNERLSRPSQDEEFIRFVKEYKDMSFNALKDIWYNQPDVYAQMKK